MTFAWVNKMSVPAINVSGLWTIQDCQYIFWPNQG